MAALDLWGLFVEQTFGGFILAVVGISALIFLIMCIFGRMSSQSTLGYLTIFWLAMAVGYGYPIITIPIATFIIWDFAMQVVTYLNKQS